MISGLLLPRKYLSWTQFDLWKKNKPRYVQEYFEKSRKLDTKYLRFGKMIAEMIEDGSYKKILPNLPIYPKHEFEIKVEASGVPLLSFLDGDDDTNGIIGEYKTGKRDKKGNAPWSKAKAQKHDQFLFYAVAKRALTGFCPTEGRLHWIETEEREIDPDDFWSEVDRKLAVTGHIDTFVREFDERELDRIEAEIVQTALEISAAYKLWIAEI